MTVMKWVFCIVPILEFVGRAHGQAIVQTQVQPQNVGRSIRDGQVTTVFLAPRYVTAIRMPEPINSVVVGDPSSFSAEHSDREPNLVFVQPITASRRSNRLRNCEWPPIPRRCSELLSTIYWTVNNSRHCRPSTARSPVSRHRARNW